MGGGRFGKRLGMSFCLENWSGVVVDLIFSSSLSTKTDNFL
mgnify:CR=1 FL=1